MSDRYEVIRQIGKGGMAELLEAYVVGQGNFRRRVAIKRLLPERVDDEPSRAAFMDEANLLSRLDHRNIVSIFDLGVLDGVPIQVLELIDGLDLTKLTARAEEAGFPMPPEIAVHVTGQIARGLAAVHEARDLTGEPLGIVHRDVTPRNVLVSWAGDVKLVDFGIAFAHRRSQHTRVGWTKGTLPYMAPEQALAAPVDPRTDLFALGCVLHFLLSGQSPLATEEVRVAVYAGSRLPIAPDFPDPARQLLTTALEPDRRNRYANAEEMALACEGASAAIASSTGGEPVTMERRLRRWLERVQPAHKTKSAPAPANAWMFDFALVESSPLGGGPREFKSVRASIDLSGIPGNEEKTERGVDDLTEGGSTLPTFTERTVPNETTAADAVSMSMPSLSFSLSIPSISSSVSSSSSMSFPSFSTVAAPGTRSGSASERETDLDGTEVAPTVSVSEISSASAILIHEPPPELSGTKPLDLEMARRARLRRTTYATIGVVGAAIAGVWLAISEPGGDPRDAPEGADLESPLPVVATPSSPDDVAVAPLAHETRTPPPAATSTRAAASDEPIAPTGPDAPIAPIAVEDVEDAEEPRSARPRPRAPSPESLRRRLSAIGERLNALGSSSALPVDKLEGRYFKARAALSSGPDAARLRALAREVEALERDLERARSR